MPLMSLREYARRRKITVEAVRKRTQTLGGPIPLHGAAKQIDSDEADRLWFETMGPSGAATSRFQGPPGTAPPAAAPLPALTQARTALVLAEAQLRRLRLEERHGSLLDKQATLARVFAFVRGFRDAWQSWPARVAAELAAEVGVDQARMAIALETYVRRHLDELAASRFDLG
jgi:hypothetical protein